MSDAVDGLCAGLDVSTQSTKLVVIDPVAGAVLHVDRVEYDRELLALLSRRTSRADG